MHSPLAVLFNRRFWPLFWAQFLGAFNDNFLKNAVIILITYQGATVLGLPSASMSTLAPALLMLPYIVFSAMAGQVADRLPKAWLIQRVKVVEIALMGIAAVGFVTGHATVLMLVILLLGLQATFFGPIKYSILPQLLGDDALVVGNALVEMGTNIAILVGQIAGGILATRARRAHGLHWPDHGCVLGWLSTLFLPATPSEAPDLKVDWNPLSTTWHICRDVARQRPIFLSILAASWFWLYGSALASLFLAHARDALPANGDVVTLFFAVFSIGVAVGSILCERLSFERLELGLVPFGSIGMTLFAADLLFAWPGQPAGLPLLGVTQFMHHAGAVRIMADLLLMSISPASTSCRFTHMQSRAEPGERSRVVAAMNVISSLSSSAGR